MKSNSDNVPQIMQPLGNGKYYLNFNIEEVTIDERQSYNYDSIYVDSIDRITLIKALISEKYSIEDEVKLLYRGTPEQKQEHEDYVAWCKKYVDSALAEFEEV